MAAPPRVLPRYLAVDRTATYKVYVYQDPAGPRTVVMAFGDGTTTRKTVEVSVVTDICPDGTREGTPAEEADEALAGEAPECLRQS